MPGRLSFLFAAATAIVAAPAHATLVVPLDLAGLVEHSDRICVGKIESQVSRWTSNRDAIYTDFTLRIAQVMKGSGAAGETVIVRREGGEVGGMGMRVTGAANFTVGEEVVVFLEQRGGPRGALYTVGMAQGKMRIDTVDGKKVAIRDLSGVAFVTPPTVEEPRTRPLDELVAKVRALAVKK